MKEFEAIIGLEIHAEMKTKSKMFSSAPVTFGDKPNTHVALFDMAFPGTLPLVNKQAVINAIRVCHALHMTIDNELWFDRKNYFYSDLPKGYQITQEKRPIGKEGYLEIKTKEGNKRIGIERLHLEEDTCKQLHYSDYSLLDYNRAGIPLIEIVSKPEIRNGEEALKYVEKIRSIVSFLDVSDGKMEEGSLRCDVNISLKEKNSDKFGTKVEIKNINSLSNIQKAIDYEIDRQKRLLINGEKIVQETRRFDEKNKKTVVMRIKIDSVDYKCFTEPNIIPIRLSDEFINTAIKDSPELAEAKLKRYLEIDLNEYDSNQLVANKEISDYFDEVLNSGANPKLAANWINVEVLSYLGKENINIKDFPIEPIRLSKLIKLIEDGRVSNKQARDIFNEMLKKKEMPEDILKSLGTTLINDEDIILKEIVVILDKNPQTIIDFKNGKDRAVGFIIGQVMKKTGGKVNPKLTNRLVIEELKRR